MDQEKTYTIEADEDYQEFIRRVITEQPAPEPLHIVEQLTEIAVGEVKDHHYELSAVASEKHLTVTLRHSGKRIDGRLILIMGDNTDRVDYQPDGDDWVLTIRRDVPPPFITRRYKRLFLSTSLLLLATPFCYANGYTLAEANSIIAILIVIVIALIGFGAYGMHHNRLISQRNEQMRRILTALDEYRSLAGDGGLSLDKQEEILKNKLQKSKKDKAAQKDEQQNFFVMMDARINKERPFTDPDFDHEALIKFTGVSEETFCKLVPRYQTPARRFDYINSLRAEYVAKILMDRSDYSPEDVARKCGFRNTAAYISAFKFAFGITPTDYLSGMSQMFKKKER